MVGLGFADRRSPLTAGPLRRLLNLGESLLPMDFNGENDESLAPLTLVLVTGLLRGMFEK